MKKLVYHISYLVLFFTMQTHATIIESNKLEDIYKYVDQNSLVIFDIDNTLGIVEDGAEAWVDYRTDDLLKKGLSYDDAFPLVIAMFCTLIEFAKLKPIGNSPDIVKNLQKKEIPVIALTKRSPPFANATIKHLKNIGIDLSKNKLYQKDLLLPVTYLSLFSHGIIFTGGNTKGNVLAAFLKKINYTPKKIIFIDDQKKRVVSVEQMCKKHNIPFIGIRFSLMDNIKKRFTPKAAKQIHELKIKAGFEPLHSLPPEAPKKETDWFTYILDTITCPLKKIIQMLRQNIETHCPTSA